MTLSDIVQKVKGLFNKGEQGFEEDERPPRQIRDKHLESLEREWQYYENQKKKELLTKKLRELKLKQIREKTFGIEQHKKEKTILDAKLENSGVDLMHPKVNLMKAKKTVLKGLVFIYKLNNKKNEGEINARRIN